MLILRLKFFLGIMNKSHTLSNTKLGLLVISGLLFLIFSLYMIGKNQNIFGSSIRITAQVAEVNGLMPGNNVRFKGMDIGTVRQLRMHNDSVIEVHLLIQKSMARFIQKNARTTINSDGLMGNKILQIHDQKGPSSPIEEGDVLYPLPQVTSEALWGKLDRSSGSLESTLINLNTITAKLAQSKALWVLLSDPSIPSELKGTLEEFHRTANSATQVAEQGKAMMQQLHEGNGLVNKLFVDTLSAIQWENSLRQLELASLHAAQFMEKLQIISTKLEHGQGVAGLLLSDTALRSQVLRILRNTEQSSLVLQEDLEALQHNFLFRNYFRKHKNSPSKNQKNIK